MTDEADSSVVLAELQIALFRECNNQPLSPWGRPFSWYFGVHLHGVSRAEFSLTEAIPLQAVYIGHSRNLQLLYGSPWSRTLRCTFAFGQELWFLIDEIGFF